MREFLHRCRFTRWGHHVYRPRTPATRKANGFWAWLGQGRPFFPPQGAFEEKGKSCSGKLQLLADTCLDQFDRNGRGFAAANAQTGNAALFAAVPQRMQQGGQNAGPRGANGMTQGAGAAVDVNFGRVQP